MADFVAVLRKTLDGLGETTPEMRTKVYDKARATVAAKLAALNPPPPPAVAERQKKVLEDAIVTIESEYAPAKPAFEDPLEELENVFAALKEAKPLAPTKPTASAAPAAKPSLATPTLKPSPQPAPVTAKVEAPRSVPMPKAVTPPPLPSSEPDDEIEAAPVEERPFQDNIDYDEPEPRRRSYGGLIAAVIALAVIGGGGYGIWLNKDEFTQMLGLSQSGPLPTTPASQPAETPAGETQQPADVAAAPASDAATPAGQEQPAGPPKFTQRLNADGTEVDAGPAGGEQTFGEGTSVASLTTPVASDQPPTLPPSGGSPDQAAPADATPPADAATAPAGATPAADAASASAADPAAAPPEASAPDPAAPADPAATPDPAAPANVAPPAQPAAAPAGQQQVAVGQRAIFYEERTSSAQGSAEPGTIVWTEVQESPGGDLPPEPAIRAEATIPGKDIQLRMTIRRNGDKTLPASHIIEMIFLTPEGFDGGGIDNVLRIALKGSEQDAGSPLLGIPAKIADGFFLIALNDSKNEIETNLNLLRRQNWIDIPIVYKSGRRALFTMEKGVPGEKVFDETIKAWQPNTAG